MHNDIEEFVSGVTFTFMLLVLCVLIVYVG